MSEGPADEGPSTGPPDRRTLRALERRLAAEPLVDRTTFEPSGDDPRALEATLDSRRYPPTVESARLDVRWFTTGDFTFHYVETAEHERWECHWDRHPNAHDARFHFHEPPTAETVTDLELPSLHPIDVVSTVLAAIETRIEDSWS
ncbi:hypothetical protein [Halopiger goleimassiliensis]|uniref:hypothetical protein n=1 Tax=Halopiger goleimassiliensis TaxID=1293048 RepID=UPI000677EA94|nr:hypothetical protein [Halopiger goleimassiliensis]